MLAKNEMLSKSSTCGRRVPRVSLEQEYVSLNLAAWNKCYMAEETVHVFLYIFEVRLERLKELESKNKTA